MNWAQIHKARARIEAGYYGDPVIESRLLSKALDAMIKRLTRCPLEAESSAIKGNKYRDLTADLFTLCLDYVVDLALLRKEFGASGGRGDLDFPVRIEEFGKPDYYYWRDLHERYGLMSVVVEVKNLRQRASVDHIAQLEGYLRHSSLGRVGFAVSRRGFSKNASQRMVSCAHDGDCLILPFSQNTLRRFAFARKRGPANTMRFLRRQESLLAQGTCPAA